LSDTHISVPAVEASQCSDECREVVHTLARIGDKWTVMVVGVLSNGPIRYNQIARLIEGISQRMLTLTLKGLEQDGLVSRTMYPTIPPRVDYELTDLGRSLIVPLQVLHSWAVEHRPAMLAAREEFAKREQQTGLRQTRFTDPK
jgi:DNA-binding HxlR family transcriptional regulator